MEGQVFPMSANSFGYTGTMHHSGQPHNVHVLQGLPHYSSVSLPEKSGMPASTARLMTDAWLSLLPS